MVADPDGRAGEEVGGRCAVEGRGGRRAGMTGEMEEDWGYERSWEVTPWVRLCSESARRADRDAGGGALSWNQWCIVSKWRCRLELCWQGLVEMRS